jgi:hypothetical protein
MPAVHLHDPLTHDSSPSIITIVCALPYWSQLHSSRSSARDRRSSTSPAKCIVKNVNLYSHDCHCAHRDSAHSSVHRHCHLLWLRSADDNRTPAGLLSSHILRQENNSTQSQHKALTHCACSAVSIQSPHPHHLLLVLPLLLCHVSVRDLLLSSTISRTFTRVDCIRESTTAGIVRSPPVLVPTLKSSTERRCNTAVRSPSQEKSNDASTSDHTTTSVHNTSTQHTRTALAAVITFCLAALTLMSPLLLLLCHFIAEFVVSLVVCLSLLCVVKGLVILTLLLRRPC